VTGRPGSPAADTSPGPRPEILPSRPLKGVEAASAVAIAAGKTRHAVATGMKLGQIARAAVLAVK
jgi:hypothetical protein